MDAKLEAMMKDTKMSDAEKSALKQMFQKLRWGVKTNHEDKEDFLLEISGALKIMRLIGKLTDEQDDDIWIYASDVERGE